ncbi:MAG TPA: LysM peptidoglycan-binding domain-containing protein [Bryobacteraceae bacterium]|nr:LysM peptidoglycan-binding domain-containing protein [Bryobacteraceae bacterium]
MADQLEQMKQKYQSVFTAVQQEGVRLTHVNMEGNKLFIQGDASSEQAKNKVWDVIKTVNPNWQNDLIADIRVTGGGQQSTPQAAAPQQPQAASGSGQRTYTVKPGDTLSKIAGELLGSAHDYMKIFEANRDQLSDPNKIKPGQTLKIPG